MSSGQACNDQPSREKTHTRKIISVFGEFMFVVRVFLRDMQHMNIYFYVIT